MAPLSALACLLCAAALWPAQEAQKPRVIFDSDMSSDWDDVGDIAVLHGLASLGECEIIGMMASSQNGATATCMDAINTWYGRPDIPIGVRPDTGGIGMYAAQIAAEYPHDLRSAADCPPAGELYRRLLAAQPDRSVTIVSTGYLNNLQALLASGPDRHSPLSGIELARLKVKQWVCAGGCFPGGDEFNFRVEPAAAKAVIDAWPAPVMYVGFDIGSSIYTCGPLAAAPTANPIRRVYVDIKKHIPYPSWGQIAGWYAVRGSGGLWGAVTTGRNTCDEKGGNRWSTADDPAGDREQGYLTEVVRTPVRDGLDALIMLPPNDGKPSIPGWPSDLRAQVAAPGRVDLRWTDNAFNETGFRIERRRGDGWVQAGSVAAGVTAWSDTGLASTANLAYRVMAVNAVGASRPACVWIYSGWTEISAQDAGGRPLYSRWQHANLRWARGGDFRPEHVALNDDSQHGRDVVIEVDVGAMGAEGAFHVYLLYQDQDNWYRLSVDRAASRFEKRIRGATTQVGEAGKGVDIGNGGDLHPWRIEMTSRGGMAFSDGGAAILAVSERCELETGRIGLGGRARTPVWESFRFSVPAAAPR